MGPMHLEAEIKARYRFPHSQRCGRAHTARDMTMTLKRRISPTPGPDLEPSRIHTDHHRGEERQRSGRAATRSWLPSCGTPNVGLNFKH